MNGPYRIIGVYVWFAIAIAYFEHCKLFATDAILGTLMTCTRSQYFWDMIVQVTNTVCLILKYLSSI